MPDVTRRVARLRVPLGFLSAILVLWLAQPTRQSLVWGSAIAAVGEALRIWAAGHLNKSREVTSSGPYRWFAHPLYVGSSIMGVGLAVASHSIVVAVVIALYLSVTVTAAIRSEEAFLQQAFGVRYERYRQGADGIDSRRKFSVAQVYVNREYRALAGVVVAILTLILKMFANSRHVL